MTKLCLTWSNLSTRKYFTLLELLVIISILSILASLLLPALKDAVAIAKSTNCMNKQKQCGTAIMIYADDYNDNFLPGYHLEGIGYRFAAWSAFITGIPAHGYDTTTTSYLNKANDIRCPYQPPDLLDSDNRWVNYGYGGSADMQNLPGVKKIEYDNLLVRFSTLVNSSDIPYLTDTSLPSNGAWNNEWQWGAWYGNKPNSINVHLRHNNGVNMLYLDSHAEHLIPGELEEEGIQYYYFDDYSRSY